MRKSAVAGLLLLTIGCTAAEVPYPDSVNA